MNLKTNFKMEQWKDVAGYEGIYQASTLGKIRSLDRQKMRINGSVISLKGKVITGNNNGRGYLKLRLSGTSVYVHQVIAMAFLDYTRNGHEKVVDHIDNDKMNNRLDNLQIITQRNNSSKDNKDCSSLHTGVTWCKTRKKWRSSIQINKKHIHLGYFISEIESHEAYQNKLKTLQS